MLVSPEPHPDQPKAAAPPAGAASAGRRRGKRRRTPPQTREVSRATLDRQATARAAVAVPPITYPEQLPVSARRDDIATAIRDHQVVIVAGETGSGKTTQLPKILLDLGRGRAGQIGHTQPRRIAARTVAERIAEEIGVPLGGVVGYQVRFTDTSSQGTLIKVMTDGILLAQIQRDPKLLAYDTIVIDEAHERSLNIDFLLGYLSRLLPGRPDLKLIITSATIDSERFALHFSPARLAEIGGAPDLVVAALPTKAPVVEVTGRTYPVEIRYRPLTPEALEATGTASGSPRRPAKGKALEKDLMTGIVEACDELMAIGPGDILVFLSGEREIHDAADALAGHLKDRARDARHPDHVEIVPLYARLSAAEQHRVFQPHTARRIVLATNVAETSLTVPGIHYVVDPGTARISRYSKATKVQRLPIEAISQASANQRSGRSGRVADGVAIRLYSAADFESRPEFTEPEILRTSLASVLLQMISVGVVASPDEVAKFPFVEPPDTRAIRDGVALLTELGALETGRPAPAGDASSAARDAVRAGGPAATTASRPATRLTEIGRALAQLPMDPRLARMIWEAGRLGVAREVAIIAAALSIQDPRERPAEFRAQADELHRRFADPTSDFLTYLALWEYLRENQRELSSSAFRRLCKGEYINFLRVREWQDVVAQLREMAAPLGIDMAYRPAGDGDTIHRAILTGLLSQLGMQDTGEVKASSVAHLRGQAREKALRRAAKQARNEYLGPRNARFAIFPGSPLSKKPPAWIMAGELVETSRLWARDVARIRPEWAEEAAGPLARHVYSEPHWSTKQGAAIVREKVLLYGLPIVTDRKVLFARVDPEGARELFIRHALVEGEWTTPHRFFHDNQRLLAEAEELAARSRQRGLVIDDDALFAFYDERLPTDIVSARHFDTWWKGARRREPELLTFTLDLLLPQADGIDTEAFPTQWPHGELSLPLTYQFEPGSQADGVTVHIPIAVLNRVSADGFDWMVPGLLDELTVATIRSLPKPVRVQLVPAPDVARDVAQWLRENTPAWADIARAGDMAEPFQTAFTRAVRAVRGVDIPPEVWTAERIERLPAHLRMTFQVEEQRGQRGTTVVLDTSRDLAALHRQLAPQSQAAVRAAVKGAVGQALREAQAATARADAAAGPASAPPVATGSPGQGRPGPGLPPNGRPADETAQPASAAQPAPAHTVALIAEVPVLTTWPSTVDGALPTEVGTDLGHGMVVRGFPAIVEEQDARGNPVAALRVLSDSSVHDREHARGIRRLLLTETALPTARITSRWTGQQALTLGASPYRTTEALVADLQLAAVIALTSGDPSAPGGPTPAVGASGSGSGHDAARIRTAEEYQAALVHVRERLEDQVHTVVGHVVAALTAARVLDGEIRAAASLTLLNTVTDLRDELGALIYDGFISATPPLRLGHLTRYLRAASMRLEKATSNASRDAELAWRIHDVEEAYTKALTITDPTAAGHLAEVPWLLAELRVSLFAQQLGTYGTISEKRIRAVIAQSPATRSSSGTKAP